MNKIPRILIVDDEPLNVDYLEQELEDLHYETLTAVNGQDALEKIAAEKPDLVLLDIMMPIMDGFTVLQKAKADSEIRNIPIIVISATNDLQSVVRGIELGAEDYLPKPFEPTLLKARIQSSLEKKHLRDLQDLYLKSLEKEFNIARDIQKEFLPAELPQIEGWEIASHFKAAKEVAGDFYDVFLLQDGKLMFTVADVCGKGIGAALFMTLFRSMIRAASTNIQAIQPTQSLSSTELLLHTISFTNNYVAETHETSFMFATVFIGVLDPSNGSIWYINGGNEPAFIIGGDGQVRNKLMPTGPVVGVMPYSKYKVAEVQLKDDEMILAFTDGIPDTQNANGQFFGENHLLELLPQDNTPTGLLDKAAAALAAFIGEADQFDDITLMAIKRSLA